MGRHYPWLWFDADNTLFDWDLAESRALRETLELLPRPLDDELLAAYRRINQELWEAMERHQITPEALKVRRFELLLESQSLPGSARELSDAYVERLALCSDLMDGALEVLEALRPRCRIALLTNGLQAVQHRRVARSAIRDYVAEVIVSEEVGAAKPTIDYFEAAAARLGRPAKRDVLLIGDSLSSDMQGGANYGVDTCWYNPSRAPRPAAPTITYEIAHLRELLALVG